MRILHAFIRLIHQFDRCTQLTRLSAESERAAELQRQAESEASSLRESLEQLSARHSSEVTSLRTSEAEKGSQWLYSYINHFTQSNFFED